LGISAPNLTIDHVTDWRESPEAIQEVDALLAGVGLEHGKRSTRTGAWRGGERVTKPRTSSISIQPEPKRGRLAAPGVLRPLGWDRYPWLSAGFSTRQGGQSEAYGHAEQNLGWTKEDAPETVAANRRRFLQAVAGPKPGLLVTVRQFHSGLIRFADSGADPLTTPDGRALLRGDALITGNHGLLLGIITADCVPVLVADVRRRVVAAFHAGWRGTLARIVERGIGAMRLQYGSNPRDLIAAIGPAIGACCFAVGQEVRFDFESQFSYAPELFSEVYDSDPVRDKYPLLFLTARAPGHSPIGPQTHLDLIEANRRQLLDSGLSLSRITLTSECTACARLPDGRRRYFSHRAEHGFTGRMLSVIGIA
jgi:polyphenol oxidase